LNMEEGSIKAVVWLNYDWTDKGLSWNKSAFGDVYDIRLPSDKIWTPDLECYNGKQLTPLTRTDQVVLTFDGSVNWIPPYMLTASCKIDTTWFPFDEQICTFKFGSWTRNGNDMDLKLQNEDGMIDIGTMNHNSDYDIVKNKGNRNEVLYECCPEPYLDVSFELTLRRRNSSVYAQRNIPSSFLAGFLAVASCLLSSKYNQISKFLVLLLCILIQGSLSVDFAKNSVYTNILSAHSGIILLNLLVSIISCCLCSPPLEALSPFLRFVITRIAGCFLRNQDKEVSPEVISSVFARVLDNLMLIVSVILFTITTINFVAVLPAHAFE